MKMSLSKIQSGNGSVHPFIHGNKKQQRALRDISAVLKQKDFRRPRTLLKADLSEKRQAQMQCKDLPEKDCTGYCHFSKIPSMRRWKQSKIDSWYFNYFVRIYQNMERFHNQIKKIRNRLERLRVYTIIFQQNAQVSRANRLERTRQYLQSQLNIVKETYELISWNFLINYEHASKYFRTDTFQKTNCYAIKQIFRNLCLDRILPFYILQNFYDAKIYICPSGGTFPLGRWYSYNQHVCQKQETGEQCFENMNFSTISLTQFLGKMSTRSLATHTFIQLNIGNEFLPRSGKSSWRHTLNDVLTLVKRDIAELYNEIDGVNTIFHEFVEVCSDHKLQKDVIDDLSSRLRADQRIASLQSLFETTVKFDSESMTRLIETVRQSLSSMVSSTTKSATKFLTHLAFIAIVIWIVDKVISLLYTLGKTTKSIIQWVSALDTLQVCGALFLTSGALLCLRTIILHLKERMHEESYENAANSKQQRKAAMQANFSGDHSFIASICQLILVVMTGKEGWNLKEFKTQVSQFPRFSQGISSIVDVIGDVVDFVKEQILNKFFGTNFDTQICNDPEVKRFHELVSMIIKQHQEGKTYTSSLIQSEVIEAELLGLKLIQRKGLGELRSSVITQWRELRKIIEVLGLSGHSARGQRIAPVIIVLQGPTNIGKSTIVTEFAIELLNKIADQEQIDKSQLQVNDLLYTRNTEQEFWDQYHGQLVCVFDDFAQRKDFAQTPNVEFFEIIRAGNTFPYPLHMATLEEKNNTLFQSRVIICTTNSKRPIIESVTHPSAVYRRFDICVEMSKNEEKYPGQQNPSEYISDYHLFKEYDITKESTPYVTDDQGVKTYDLKGLANAAFEKYKTRFCFENQRKRVANELAAKYGFRTAQLQGLFDFWKNKCNFGPEKICIGCESLAKYHAPMTLQTFKTWKKCSDGRKLTQNDMACYDGVARLFNEHKTFTEKLFDMTNKVKNFFFEHKAIFAALGLLSFAFLGRQLYKWFAGSADDKAVPESYEPTPRTTRVVTRSSTSKRALASFHKATKGICEAMDNNTRDLATKLYKKNIYVLKIGNEPIGNAFFCVGRILVLPKHYKNCIEMALHLDPNVKVSLFNMFDTKNVTYEMLAKNFIEGLNDFYEDNEIDMVSIDFKLAHDHPSIIKHMPSESLSRSITYTGIQLIGSRFMDGIPHYYSQCTSAKGVRRNNQDHNVYGEELPGTAFSGKYSTTDYFEYDLATSKGDCGSLLLADSTAIRTKLLGMHIMGIENDNKGFSIPFYKEDFEQHVLNYGIEARIEAPTIKIEGQLQSLPFKGECVAVGVSPFIYEQPPQSKIIKSCLHPDNNEVAWSDSKTRPTLLRKVKPYNDAPFEPNDGDYFDPKLYRLEKCCLPSQCVDQEILDIVTQAYVVEITQELISTAIPPHYKSCSTFEEAVCGVDADPYIKSVTRSTSAGYGWVPDKGKPGKTTWFGSEGDIDLVASQPVRQRVEDKISLAQNLKRDENIFIDTLKDERKPKEKYWKTRVFSACSQDYYIACKQYFQGIVALLTRHRIKTGIAVGINVYGAEWEVLVRHLTQYSQHMVAGDFENFDSSLLTQILQACFKVLNAVAALLPDYHPDHDLIREVLSHDLFNSYHCDKNILYMWTHSLPSGHYLTAIVNSIFVNLVFMYLYIYVLLQNKRILNNENAIFKACRQLRRIAYGDDHIVAIPSENLDIFNQNTLPILFAQIGMIYTDETKNKNHLVPDSRPISDVTFLKRSFRFEPKLSRFIAPLTLDTVLETPYWVHKSKITPYEICQINTQWAIHELALHSQEIFDMYSSRILAATKQQLRWVPELYTSRIEHIKYLETTMETECDLL